MKTLHSVSFLLFPQFQLLDVCGPLQVFVSANDILQECGHEAFYQTTLYSAQARLITSSCSVALSAEALPTRLVKSLDTLIVPGGPGVWQPTSNHDEKQTQHLVDWVRSAKQRVNRVASVCTGAFVLARSGLLDGRHAVTHWLACESLQSRFPSITVEKNAIYFKDGPYWTSAGVTAGIDMALSMVQNDVGHDIAMSVAKRLVVFYKRPGGQSQFSSALLEQSTGNDRIKDLHDWIRKHLRSPLSITDLAEHMSMVPRTFARFYRECTGVTPAHAVLQIRLERACELLEKQKISVKEVSRQCGFSSEEIMRRAFLRYLHVGPADYKQRFSE